MSLFNGGTIFIREQPTFEKTTSVEDKSAGDEFQSDTRDMDRIVELLIP